MINRGLEKTFEGDGYVYDIDCGDGFMGICLSPSSSSFVH